VSSPKFVFRRPEIHESAELCAAAFAIEELNICRIAFLLP
jgi:hypothetical protein